MNPLLRCKFPATKNFTMIQGRSSGSHDVIGYIDAWLLVKRMPVGAPSMPQKLVKFAEVDPDLSLSAETTGKHSNK